MMFFDRLCRQCAATVLVPVSGIPLAALVKRVRSHAWCAGLAAAFLFPWPLMAQQTAKSQDAIHTDSLRAARPALPSDTLAHAAVAKDSAAKPNAAPVSAHLLPSVTQSTSGKLSPADSLKRVAKRDSLFAQVARSKETYLHYVTSADSIFGARSIAPAQFLRSDGLGFSEEARIMPAVVAVPYALSSGVNRFMSYGFPLLPNAVFLDNNAFPEFPTALSGTDNIFSTQVTSAASAGSQGVSVTQIPSGLVIPQTALLWENALFGENSLGVRFARPLTQTIDLAILSNYRHFAPNTYGTAGDMTALFNNFVSDTSLLANGGRNPQSNETSVSIALGTHGHSWGNGWFEYTYDDATNDLALQQSTAVDSSQSNSAASAPKQLQWESMWHYANTVRAEVRSMPAPGRIMFNMDAKAIFEGNTGTTPNAAGDSLTQQTGRNTDVGFSVTPFLPFAADTLLVSCTGEHSEKLLYNNLKATVTTSDVRVGYRHAASLSCLKLIAKATIGEGAAASNGIVGNQTLLYSADVCAEIGSQTLHLFALRDRMPLVLPFDSLSEPARSYVNAYNAYGADMILGDKKLGITLGVCGVSGIDTSAAARYWPDGQMPYRQPHVAFTAAPFAGRWLGFALGSRLIMSDVRPLVKVQTALSYEAHPLAHEHITVDLLYDYWSLRDTMTYAGISTWNRDLHSLSLKIAVHIQTFNIFYKIDNVLDRKYAYVPGYFMPGITFRWGFGWLIQ